MDGKQLLFTAEMTGILVTVGASTLDADTVVAKESFGEHCLGAVEGQQTTGTCLPQIVERGSACHRTSLHHHKLLNRTRHEARLSNILALSDVMLCRVSEHPFSSSEITWDTARRP